MNGYRYCFGQWSVNEFYLTESFLLQKIPWKESLGVPTEGEQRVYLAAEKRRPVAVRGRHHGGRRGHIQVHARTED